MNHNREGLSSASLLHGRESSHPSIGQILDNIWSKNIFTELLLLNEIQSL
jgi:hypothetical protein